MSEIDGTFADSLRLENAEIWKAIRSHPFIVDTENNTLTNDRLRFYFEQNIQYIDLSYRLHSLAAAKCTDEATLDSLKVTLRRGMPGSPDKGAHQQEILKELGGNPDKLPEMAPANKAYTDHLFRIAYERETVDLIAAFIPCPWTYDVIAREILPKITNPVAFEWLEWWTSQDHLDLVNSRIDAVNRIAPTLAPERQQEVRDAFRASMRFEWLFWDDAYHMRSWPV